MFSPQLSDTVSNEECQELLHALYMYLLQIIFIDFKASCDFLLKIILDDTLF